MDFDLPGILSKEKKMESEFHWKSSKAIKLESFDVIFADLLAQVFIGFAAQGYELEIAEKGRARGEGTVSIEVGQYRPGATFGAGEVYFFH